MRMSQYRALSERYRIIMWDLVTRDYNPRLTGEQVLGKVKRYARNGSIITFHDSLRATHNLYYALPRAIEWLLAEGYEFKVFE
jgi:peptidoglycan/xylan/chitin deacetylase (PgdA/CDA1 family)